MTILDIAKAEGVEGFLHPAECQKLQDLATGRDVLEVGAFMGLLLGAVAAATKDFLDRTVHTREDVEEATGGIPMLGVIPQFVGAGVGANGNGASANGAKNGRARTAAPRIESSSSTTRAPMTR